VKLTLLRSLLAVSTVSAASTVLALGGGAATATPAVNDVIGGCTYGLALKDASVTRTPTWIGTVDGDSYALSASFVLSRKVDQWAICTDETTGHNVIWDGANGGKWVQVWTGRGPLNGALVANSDTVGPAEQLEVYPSVLGCAIESATTGAQVRANTHYDSIEYAASGVSDAFFSDSTQICEA
jgi:hypothetical protein